MFTFMFMMNKKQLTQQSTFQKVRLHHYFQEQKQDEAKRDMIKTNKQNTDPTPTWIPPPSAHPTP